MLERKSTATEVVDYLNLQHDPTGNVWFKIIQHDIRAPCVKFKEPYERANSTSFIHLYDQSKFKFWHRVKSSMTYNFIAGSPPLLKTGDINGIASTQILGSDFTSNNVPISLVKPNQWQKLSTTGDWSLISGTYSPGFEYADLEIAISGWAPGQGEPALSFPGEIWEP